MTFIFHVSTAFLVVKHGPALPCRFDFFAKRWDGHREHVPLIAHVRCRPARSAAGAAAPRLAHGGLRCGAPTGNDTDSLASTRPPRRPLAAATAAVVAHRRPCIWSAVPRQLLSGRRRRAAREPARRPCRTDGTARGAGRCLHFAPPLHHGGAVSWLRVSAAAEATLVTRRRCRVPRAASCRAAW